MPASTTNDPRQAAVGNVIREERERKGLSRRQFADMLGVSVVRVLHLENGHNFPTIPVMIRCAEALEMPVSRLLGKIGSVLDAHK